MNVLNDNWLFVRYNTGKVKQISVRQAFLDAEKIKDIETPTFHGTTVSLYDVPVIQFLSILLLDIKQHLIKNLPQKVGMRKFLLNILINGKRDLIYLMKNILFYKILD